MTTESDRQTYYSSNDFYTPDWWNDWSRKNLKRKLKEFSRRLKQQEYNPQ
jgi:hypothetical protein